MNYWPFCIHIIHLKPKMQLIRHVVNLYKFLSRLVFYVFMPMLWCFWMYYGNVSSACCIFTVLVHFRLRGISLVGDIETSFHDMSNFLNFGRFERFAYTSHNNMLTSYTAFICEESRTKKCNLFQIKDDIGLTNSVLFLNFKKQRIT